MIMKSVTHVLTEVNYNCLDSFNCIVNCAD